MRVPIGGLYIKKTALSLCVWVLCCAHLAAHQKEESRGTYSFQAVPAWVERIDVLSGRWLDTEVLSDRTYPYSLNYPAWVREHIRITRDADHIEEKSECIEVREPFMQFGYFYQSAGQQTEIGYELKTLGIISSSKKSRATGTPLKSSKIRT